MDIKGIKPATLKAIAKQVGMAKVTRVFVEPANGWEGSVVVLAANGKEAEPYDPWGYCDRPRGGTEVASLSQAGMQFDCGGEELGSFDVFNELPQDVADVCARGITEYLEKDSGIAQATPMAKDKVAIAAFEKAGWTTVPFRGQHGNYGMVFMYKVLKPWKGVTKRGRKQPAVRGKAKQARA